MLKEKVLKWSILAGIGTGIFFFIQYCAFSFGFWYGSHCVAGSYRCPTSTTGSVYTPGEVTIVFFALFVGSFNFMQLLPNVTAILDGLKAAKRLYKIIDLQPSIGKNSNGLKLDKIKGEIMFENVTFGYPKDKDVKVLKNISLQMNAGAINAFVGDSGCGKSTIIQLVMRFYDPDEGRITLDGNDIKSYDIEWLRSQIGYVGQEPCLFEGTVLTNILIGNPQASVEEVNEALIKA
jgi:ATP-binding cassette subfamily B (MDR/TAP) protein 1